MGRRRKPPAYSGLLLVDKPSGVTSHDVVRDVRRALGQQAVGHTGTLDPMATGLLVIALGRATRLARFIEATDKTYVGTVFLGRATTTYDAEGETTDEASIEGIDATRIAAAASTLLGTIKQQVPAYSAIKVDGERLYKKARRGEAVDTPIREVVIHELDITRCALPEVEIRARVSKGTYIRTLAVQLGAALGVPAYLPALRRTAVGSHRVDEAMLPTAIDPDRIVPVRHAVDHLAAIRLDAATIIDVGHGRVLDADRLVALGAPPISVGQNVRLIDETGEIVAVAKAVRTMEGAATGEGVLEYACVLKTASEPR